jgi:hypothetical protein
MGTRRACFPRAAFFLATKFSHDACLDNSTRPQIDSRVLRTPPYPQILDSPFYGERARFSVFFCAIILPHTAELRARSFYFFSSFPVTACTLPVRAVRFSARFNPIDGGA